MTKSPYAFSIYLPCNQLLSRAHKSICSLTNNPHLKSILNNSTDLFIADSAHILSILLSEIKEKTLTYKQEKTVIDMCFEEYMPLMESSLLEEIETIVQGLSGREEDHYFTLDMLDMARNDYEQWLTSSDGCGAKYAVQELLDVIFNAHLRHNMPTLMTQLNARPGILEGPLNMQVTTNKNLLLNVFSF